MSCRPEAESQAIPGEYEGPSAYRIRSTEITAAFTTMIPAAT